MRNFRPVDFLPRCAISKRLRYEKQIKALHLFRLLSLEMLHRRVEIEKQVFRKKSTPNITVSVWLNPDFRNYLILNTGFRFSVNAFNPS
jgi:hypothetical protein